MATTLDELEMTQVEALRLADGVAHRADGTSQALSRLAQDLRMTQKRVAALEACAYIIPQSGMVYEL